MIRILLIRHGSTELMRDVLCGRMAGVHLDSEGERQAAELARQLNSEARLAAVISSPLERALETARAIAAQQGLDVSTDEHFNEVEFGDWTGKRFADLQGQPAWRAYNEHRSLSSAPGGESLLTVQGRGWTGIANIWSKYDGGSVAVITHGDVIRALLMLLLGMPLDEISRLEIAPASLSEISLGPGGPVINGLNRRCGAT